MTEKRFKVAVYDDKAINGFAVLDLQKPNSSKRLKYENVYIGSKAGCEIVCNFGNNLAEENEQLKQTVSDWSGSYDELYEDVKRLEKENEQLKQRNENQYNQLTELWGLIKRREWEILIEMDNKIKEDEERLQQEWKCYE